MQDAQTQARNKPLTLDNDESPHQPSILQRPCPETVVHEHKPEPKPLPPAMPGETELAIHSKQQLPKREYNKMSSPSAGWHDVEIAPPQPANHKPPVSPAKAATPHQSRHLAGLLTENNGLQSTTNYVNSLCNNRETRRWENLCAYFVTTSAPPTLYHEEFAYAGKA